MKQAQCRPQEAIMVNPISPNIAPKNQPSFELPARPEVSPSAASNADVVELSNSAQAKLLKQQGLNVAQIAIKLGLDVKTVSSYLPSVATKAAG
jgi:DNA-binding NarL/FixJ family response regulator